MTITVEPTTDVVAGVPEKAPVQRILSTGSFSLTADARTTVM
jgi:hypothetical protein